MIKELYYVFGVGTNPYQNLALEEYLLENVKPGQCILYLWQNARTVVVGRNQNCWRECRIQKLEEEGGFLVRRLSGGGAVFHDLGNLNFTFLVEKADYDVAKQLEVILQGVRKFGIDAEKSGRNDITIEGRKFSGNAFYRAGSKRYHHGTILIDVDTEELSKYLQVSKEKLAMKGVESVKSRVMNLKECNSEIDVPQMKEKLLEAFGEVYGGELKEWQLLPKMAIEIQEKAAWFSSDLWKYGKSAPFEYEISHRFEWGDLCLQLAIEKGQVKEAGVWSDGMDAEFFPALSKALIGRRFSGQALAVGALEIQAADDLQKEMREDIADFLERQEF